MNQKQEKFIKFKEFIKTSVTETPELMPNFGIFVSIIKENNCKGLSDLYSSALERGDWMATEYIKNEKFSPSTQFFKKQIENPYQIWFAFERDNRVVGSTKLELCENGSVIIDETQLEPKYGQGRKIMENYFRRFIPLLESQGFMYWTEFVLSLGSRSLRKTLLVEQRMVATGVRINCYKRGVGDEYVSCLTAYGPQERVVPLLKKIETSSISIKVKEFVRILITDETAKNGKVGFSPLESSEILLPFNKKKEIDIAIENGYIPVSINPFSSVLILNVPDETLGSKFWYLEREKNDDVKKIARYIFNNGFVLEKTANKTN